jgi:NADPH-dependent glutamate synthase beta subunit-like oxidoreductase
MERILIEGQNSTFEQMQELCNAAERRMQANPLQRCPVDMLRAYLRISQGQSCGKCVPCRVGLRQMELLLDDILAGRAGEESIELLRKTARVISNTSDCAIGYEAADTLLRHIDGFMDDFLSHIRTGSCMVSSDRKLPCVARCPAHVDIPGYVALAGAGRCDDAVSLIRKDNPFPAVCGYVCEHPCEVHCRRRMIDEPINIRAIKRYVTDNAPDVPPPEPMECTGRSVAVIGGGPCGMTAAYYLSLMGHKVTVLEQRAKLGGMLRYGIPSYRLPRGILDQELNVLRTTGIETKTGVKIGRDVTMEQLRSDYDAVCIAIGAHTHKKLGIPGEDAEGVISALELLRGIGDDDYPIFQGQRVAIIGGGNVAMDAARTAKRLGAERVTVVYRRRKVDMPALPDEVEGAIAEGCEVLRLHAPKAIEAGPDDKVTALMAQPQIVGKLDEQGRPKPGDAPEPCVAPAVRHGDHRGRARHRAGALVKFGVPVANGTVAAAPWSGFEELPGVFSGGDCVSGPATVIRAIAAGKVLASNIDHYLGYAHVIESKIDIPAPNCIDRPAMGRVDTREREAAERQADFRLMEYCMTEAEAKQECSRCLRCDHFGYGSLKGGRNRKW